MTAQPATPREVIDAAFPSMTGLGALVLKALAAAGYRIAGPDEVVVPREPTKEMCLAGEEAIESVVDWTRDTEGSYMVLDKMEAAATAYRAMLSAAEGDGQ